MSAEEEKRVLCGKIRLIVTESGFSPSLFADKIEVQRSSISHILSERNKPSLEIVDRILKNFSKITYEWLMDGNLGSPLPTGAFINLEEPNVQSNRTDNTGQPKFSDSSKKTQPEPKVVQGNQKRGREKSFGGNSFGSFTNGLDGKVQRITIFYNDGNYRDLPPEDVMKLVMFNVVG